MNDNISVLISQEKVEARIQEMADVISEEYKENGVHLICILKGSVFFMCELAKRLTCPTTMDFICTSSYGDGTQSSGIVKFSKDLDESIEGKHCIVIEDILDSGRTLHYVLGMLEGRKPASLKVITLLDKPERRVVPVELDMTGFVVPDSIMLRNTEIFRISV